jgi:hypothetical protein
MQCRLIVMVGTWPTYLKSVRWPNLLHRNFTFLAFPHNPHARIDIPRYESTLFNPVFLSGIFSFSQRFFEVIRNSEGRPHPYLSVLGQLSGMVCAFSGMSTLIEERSKGILVQTGKSSPSEVSRTGVCPRNGSVFHKRCRKASRVPRNGPLSHNPAVPREQIYAILCLTSIIASH